MCLSYLGTYGPSDKVLFGPIVLSRTLMRNRAVLFLPIAVDYSRVALASPHAASSNAMSIAKLTTKPVMVVASICTDAPLRYIWPAPAHRAPMRRASV